MAGSRRRTAAGAAATAVALALVVALSGCGLVQSLRPPTGETLVTIGYPDDVARGVATSGVWAGPDAEQLADQIDTRLRNPVLAQKIRDRPSDGTIVALEFDGCTKSDPRLVRSGRTLSVHYQHTDPQRNCVRAVQTWTIFALDAHDLTRASHVTLCGETLDLARTARPAIKSC